MKSKLMNEPDYEKMCRTLRPRALKVQCPVCPAGIEVSCFVDEDGKGDVHYRRVIDAAFGVRRAN